MQYRLPILWTDFFMLHQYVYAMLAFATLGVLVPFFYYNVFGNAKHGRKIFMGDTGSLTIGMMLCFLSLKLTMCGLDDNTGNVHPMVLAFSPLLVPCCDVVRVYLHRVRNGKNPFLPDKNHIHHKLLALRNKAAQYHDHHCFRVNYIHTAQYSSVPLSQCELDRFG